MSKITFLIDANGNFSASPGGLVERGTEVNLNLDVGATWTTVYIYSGSSLALDSTLFGTSSVSVPGAPTISSEAVNGRNYTLSTSSTLPLPTGVIKGTINVGNTLTKEYLSSLDGILFPPSSRRRDDGHGYPGALVPDSSP